MSQILIRDLDPQVLARLRERAKRNNRSVAAEVRTILEMVVPARKTLEERRVASRRLIAWSDRALAESQGKVEEDGTAAIRRQRGPIGPEATTPSFEDSAVTLRRRRGPLGP